MGVLCDLFTSAPAEAASYPDSLGKADPRFQKAEFKGLTSLEFGTLRAILAGEAFDSGRHDLEPVEVGEEEWLYRFPDAYVSLLLGLRGEQVAKAAAAWAATEELRWEPSEAEEVLTDLVRLAGAARARKLGLYFWGSL